MGGVQFQKFWQTFSMIDLKTIASRLPIENALFLLFFYLSPVFVSQSDSQFTTTTGIKG